MNTRRKSKAAAAASQVEAGSNHGDSVTLSLHLPPDIDAEALSNLLPGQSFESPSQDMILNIYRALLNQALQVDATNRDLEELRAEIEKKDVEIDQAYQDKENDKKEMECSVENVTKELKAVKHERDELAVSKAALQTQLSSLSTSSSASSTELDTLKLRVEDTDREKRDLVGVVSRLKEDCAQRDEEIKVLRANLKQSRHDYQELESQLRELRSTETSSKFKLDSLSQQLTLAKDESERSISELNVKSEEFSKYRRSKHAELSQLQSSHDTLSQKFSTVESTLKALQSSHASQTQQLTQALTRVQDLSGQLAEQEATYSSEAAGLRRLVGMMEEREAHAKDIVDGIEREWAAVGEKAERREMKLKEEIDRESRRADDAQKRVEELERVFERLDRGEFPLPSSASTGFRTPGAVPSTPIRNSNSTADFIAQGMMGLSPTVAMASRAQKTGKTFTEVYAEYVKLQEEYAKKSAEYDHMDRTLQAVLAQIEERAPILSQQRMEYERLQTEASQLASQLTSALSERDLNATQAQETSQKLKKTVRENELLESQLNDLGRQVQTLLRELTRSQDPTIPSDEELEADSNTAPPENIDEVITNNLVRFRSIQALQEQNQKLLKITRDLGAKMESEEKEYRDALQLEQMEAVMEAHQAIQRMQDDLDSHKKSSELKIQAYTKERDALKSMLSRAEQRISGMAVVSGLNGHADAGPESDSGMAKELAEVQSQFEAYKVEMGVDSVKLREELMSTQREAGQLVAALAKANAKVEYLNDRHRMAQEQFSISNREIDNLTKRNQQLYDQYTRIDIECNRVTEDLLTSNGRLEQLRNECANLRAEKNIWETVQVRLVDENKTLAVERSHLSDLMSNVQKMHNDLERSGENDRRRLESQIQMLEGQTQDLRSQLSLERDSVRHASLQKEIEARESQSRIERSGEELSKTRESLIEAETSRKHLDERVQELTRQLHGNEEKLAVYERRQTSVNGANQRVADDSLTREQQLEAEVADLRGALKVAEVDLANARSHVQQFQEISQANEEALSSLNATYDEFRSSTEAQIAKHQSDYGAIQDELQIVQAESTKLGKAHASLQQTLEKERKNWAEDKRLLEDTIADMTTSERSGENDRASRESELRQLEERAKGAEDKYSREVLSHADSIKAVEELKAQLASASTAARNGTVAAETATAKLTLSEASWKQQKDALDRELADLNKRCKDLVSQNTLLHNHLDSVSSQAAKIRDAAGSSVAMPSDTDGDSSEASDTKLSELRSVVSWLRKEKEIVELQLELSKQETARLKTQVDHLSQSLDQTRAALSEERERADETATSQAEHDMLMSKINELTVFRESNATLRADCEAKAKRILEMDSKLQQVNAELGPAKQGLFIAKAELEARDLQLNRLQEDNRKWQERNSQLMSKYDRIDPVELQGLKDELEQLKSQSSKEEKEEIENYKKQVESLETKLRESREFTTQLQQRARLQMSGLNKDKSDLNVAVNELRAQLQKRDSSKAQAPSDNVPSPDLKMLTEQIEILRKEKAVLETSFAEAKAQRSLEKPDQTAVIKSLQQERDLLLAEKATWVGSSAEGSAGASDEAKALWEAEKAKLISDRDAALAQSKDVNVQLVKMKDNLRAQYGKNQANQQRITALENEKKGATVKQQEVIDAAITKARSEIPATDSPLAHEEMVKRHAGELKGLEERLTAAHKAEIEAAVAAARQAAATPPTSSTVSDEAQKAAIESAVTAAKAEWSKTQEEALAQAVERGRMEQNVKARIKDSQLLKSQSRVKELETQLLEYQSSASNTGGASSTVLVTQASAPTAPTAAGPSTQTKPAVRGGAATRGRGTVRSLTAALGGRGGAPATASASAQPASGVSIMGAAKRPREEGESEAPPSENSLAKRLKPAEAKPVPIRRPVPKP